MPKMVSGSIVLAAIAVASSALVAIAASPQPENAGGFRGADRNGILPARGLMKQWPEDGPQLLWQAEVGQGWTAASIADGKVLFCGRAGKGKPGVMVALDLDGKQLWRTEYGPEKHPPRGTPCVSEGLVYYESTDAVLYCLDASTGEVKWSFDAKTLGDTLAKRGGCSASPLVYDDKVIIMLRSPGNEVPGGNDVPSFAAVNKRTGKLAWQGNLGPCPVKRKGWSSDNGSPVLLHAGDTPLAVCQFYRCAAAVNANTGAKVWLEQNGSRQQRRGRTMPVANEGYLFVFGTRMLKVMPDGTFKELWEGKIHVPEYNISYSHSLIKGGRLIAFTPERSMNPTKPGRLRMLDAETGEELASLQCAAKASLIWADGLIYMLDNRPAMSLIDPSNDKLRVISHFNPPVGKYGSGDGVQLFTHPVVAEGRLFLRDQSKVLVYDVRAKGPHSK